eukprot:CAMPEP_0184308724 /NCGR_PEP_ID=MMETSP1049-20130417/17074_1 /TAXON_ID=77928 /ORGANISM="Proteomonas sulcata, Strain CCMP704" /LENGTH=391 /DNA_ID=CAMNT_0026621461 /DNA_START=170 /DNA_END=1345 /DNA_ORIENTATION=-
MDGWYAENDLGQGAIIAHWVTFFFHMITTFYLGYVSFHSKGPGGKQPYFAGYHEENNIGIFVNLFAAISYFGKVVSDTHGHNYQNVGPFIIGLGNYRYADYMLTCPLLVMDLLFQLRAPYKITCAMLIFAVLMIGAVTNFYPGDDMKGPAVAWFCFGCFWYLIAYIFMAHIVSKQYGRLDYLAHGTKAEGALFSLKLAIITFFAIWVAFPLVWLLSVGTGVLSNEAAEICHCICDVVAKSVYGFALANFREQYDRELYGLLNSIGLDGEDVVQQLEKEMQTNHHKKKSINSPAVGPAGDQANSLRNIGLKSFIDRKSSGNDVMNSPAIIPHLAPARVQSLGNSSGDLSARNHGWMEQDLPGTPVRAQTDNIQPNTNAESGSPPRSNSSNSS